MPEVKYEIIKKIVVFKNQNPKEVVYLSGLAKHISAYKQEVNIPNRLHFIVGTLECRCSEISKPTDGGQKANLNQKYREN